MVIHQWPADCKDDIRLQVDCYGGKQLDTSDLGHTGLIALLPRGLGPRIACAEPARMFQSWLYFFASAGCQGGQRRGHTRLILPAPVDCGQHEMKGNMQTYSKARKGYPRIACLLEPSE